MLFTGLVGFSSIEKFEIYLFLQNVSKEITTYLDGCRHAPLPSSTSTAILSFV